jgi:hypothetical protein
MQRPVYIVTYRHIARQRLAPAEGYAHNMMPIARQRICKQAFSTLERLCFLCGPLRGVVKGQRKSFDLVVVRS